MGRLLLELTNRCNLRCRHCYSSRHADTAHLPLDLIDRVLAEAPGCGIDQVVLTGGEPTLHPQFAGILRRAYAHGVDFGLVSNGITFARVTPLLVELRDRFRGVTFSLDGVDAATHDRLRGAGSFRRVLKAATLCVFNDLPFSINMVVTAENRHQLAAMASLAAAIGSCGLRFGHLLSTASSPRPDLELSRAQMREVEDEIERLSRQMPMPVVMAPGYHCETDLFPCAPLNAEEFNLDCHGHMTLCCQLSGIEGPPPHADRVADLHRLGLAEACRCFRQRVAEYRRRKRAAARTGRFGAEDYRACRYCLKYLHRPPVTADGGPEGRTTEVPCCP